MKPPKRRSGERLTDYLKRVGALQVSMCTGPREPDDAPHDDHYYENLEHESGGA